MKPDNKVQNRKSRASVRQSVTIPAQLAIQVQRVAKARKLTMSRALVTLAEKGIKAEAASQMQLVDAYDAFMAATKGRTNKVAGKKLIQAIFGRDAIAEDPLR